MRLPAYGRSRGVGFNMTPMIDVVFLLIIFFLLSSHLAQRETHLPLPLPVATTGEADITGVTPRITLNITGNGDLFLSGSPLSPDQLAQRLVQARQKSEIPLEVRIRADKSLPYERIAPILLAVSEAEIWNVTFAVQARHEAP